MQSGKLDRRISIQSSTATPNSIGEYVATWTTVLNLWASVEYTDTREKYEGAELLAPNEVTFRTRYNSTINEKMRIIYNGKEYDILHIAEVNRREGLKIIARKKDNTDPVTPVSGIVNITEVITGDLNDGQPFSVTLTGSGTIITKSISQEAPVTLIDLPFGTYTLSQAPAEGYNLVSITPSTVVLSAQQLYVAVVITNEIEITT